MSSGETASALIEYMSKKLVEVAEMNLALEQFGEKKVGYKFKFTTTVTNNNWIRIRQGNASDADWKTFSCHEYDYGGFDFPEPAQRFETRELTELDRLKLREELPF